MLSIVPHSSKNCYNTFTADSSFPARDLNEPTANGLLTQIYGDFLADLPSDLDPYLSIDLFTNEITFNFPDNVVFASVQTVSTDQKLGISQSLEVRPIPEPTSTLSLLALGTLGAASTLKRKLKPSKSTEKETTKVG